MADSLRPQWFVTRQNGSMVPLVALDELPSTVAIQNVPRHLSSHDIQGMTGLGTHNTRHKHYAVDGKPSTFPPEKGLMASAFATPAPPFPQVPEYTATPPTTPGPSSVSPESSRSTSAPEPSTSPLLSPSPGPEGYNKDRIAQLKGEGGTYRRLDSIPAAPRRIKEYCSYWLRHGECDYAQQGCLYKHEMPLEPDVLEKLGLRDIPRWYREKHGLVSYLGGNTSVGIEEVKRPDILNTNWRSLSGQHSGSEDLPRRMQGLNISQHASPPPRRMLHGPPSRLAYYSPRSGGLFNSRYASPFPTPPRGPHVEPMSARRARAVQLERASLDAPLPRGSLSDFPPLIPGLEEPSQPSRNSSKASSTVTASSSTTSTIVSTPLVAPAAMTAKNKQNAVRAVAAVQAASVRGAKVVAAGASLPGGPSPSEFAASTNAGRSRRGHGHARRRTAAKAKAKATREAATKEAKGKTREAVPAMAEKAVLGVTKAPETKEVKVTVAPEQKPEKAASQMAVEKAKRD